VFQIGQVWEIITGPMCEACPGWKDWRGVSYGIVLAEVWESQPRSLARECPSRKSCR